MFLPLITDELSGNFKKIDEELRSQYALTYHPNNATQNGAFHKIRIETADKQLRVQAAQRILRFSRTNDTLS